MDLNLIKLLPDAKIVKLTQLANVFKIVIMSVGKANYVLIAFGFNYFGNTILSLGLPNSLPRDVCRVLFGLNLSSGQLHPNVCRYLVSTLTLFKLNGFKR